jgi:translation initiation factor eIF-2B subunit gamma
LARDEEDIEYIGLSYPSSKANSSNLNPPPLPRIVLKQSKLDVEADEDMTGSTAKLEVPKARLRHGRLVVRTEWSDVHVYSLAPWVRQLVTARESLSSIQGDLLPLLVSRQFRGKKATFGKYLQEEEQDDEKESPTQKTAVDDEPYSVLALVLSNKTALRANTIPSYLYACKEVVANGASLTMPPGSRWNGKFQSLVLEGSTLGAKVTMKSGIIGLSCQLGSKCRLNNVVIMDNVIIGDNCSLQNTLIGAGAKLGNNCSLNDCQVGPGKELPAGTKEKGESFMVGDVMAEEML